MPSSLRAWGLGCAYTVGALALRSVHARNPLVLVIGTMRSGSTLFSHLLFTNPRIIGVGEAWRIYRSPLDFDRTAAKLLAMRRTLYRRDQLFQDTLLHNHLLPKPEVLLDERIRLLFLVREPLAVLGSLFRAQIPGFRTWEEIETYYRGPGSRCSADTGGNSRIGNRSRWSITKTSSTTPPPYWKRSGISLDWTHLFPRSTRCMHLRVDAPATNPGI